MNFTLQSLALKLKDALQNTSFASLGQAKDHLEWKTYQNFEANRNNKEPKDLFPLFVQSARTFMQKVDEKTKLDSTQKLADKDLSVDQARIHKLVKLYQSDTIPNRYLNYDLEKLTLHISDLRPESPQHDDLLKTAKESVRKAGLLH